MTHTKYITIPYSTLHYLTEPYNTSGIPFDWSLKRVGHHSSSKSRWQNMCKQQSNRLVKTVWTEETRTDAGVGIGIGGGWHGDGWLAFTAFLNLSKFTRDFLWGCYYSNKSSTRQPRQDTEGLYSRFPRFSDSKTYFSKTVWDLSWVILNYCPESTIKNNGFRGHAHFPKSKTSWKSMFWGLRSMEIIRKQSHDAKQCYLHFGAPYSPRHMFNTNGRNMPKTCLDDFPMISSLSITRKSQKCPPSSLVSPKKGAGAGVGVGMLRGGGDSHTWKVLEV